MFLSNEDAQLFLKNVLNINYEEKRFPDRLGLLKEITLKFQQNVAFQNLSLLETNFTDRKLPSDEEIRRNFLSGVGGLCYPTSNFMEAFLKNLGYHVFRVAGTFPCGRAENSHIACVVKDVMKIGDDYLIDVGSGFPSFEPIPINLPQQYHQAFLQYKIVRENDGIISRYHKFGSFPGKMKTSADLDGWQKFFSFPVIPREDEFLRKYQEPIYSVPNYGVGWFLTGLRMAIYPKGRAITLNDYVLKLWDEQSRETTSIVLENSNELEKAIRMHFPMLNGINVQQAVVNWEKIK